MNFKWNLGLLPHVHPSGVEENEPVVSERSEHNHREFHRASPGTPSGWSLDNRANLLRII